MRWISFKHEPIFFKNFAYSKVVTYSLNWQGFILSFFTHPWRYISMWKNGEFVDGETNQDTFTL